MDDRSSRLRTMDDRYHRPNPRKQARNIQIVKADNGQPPGAGKALGRWGIPAVANMVTGGIGGLLVYMSLLWDSDKNRQGWHDKAAETYVVKT